MKRKVLFIFFLTILLIPFADAEVYKYIDKNGKSWYVSEGSSIPSEYRDGVSEGVILQKPNKAKRITKESKVKKVKKVKKVRTQSKQTKKVEIFVTAWCPYCRNLETFLRKNNIKYKRYDIEKSKIGKAKHKRLGGGGIPVTKIGSKVIRGYDPQRILSALK